VTMFRKQLRAGIRAVAAGRDPIGLCRDPGAAIPTYCNDTIVRLPWANSPASDKKAMREAGMRLARSYLEHPPLSSPAGV
jgi:hypothetical protein